MTTDLHSAVRTAVDEARRQTEAKAPWLIGLYWNPDRCLAMCDWADDVLRRHAAMERSGMTVCRRCSVPSDAFNDGVVMPWPCIEVRSAAAAFGVETGETP